MAEQATQENDRGLRKIREGYVVSNKMNKSVVVTISTMKKHPIFGKYVRETKRFMAHDETNECQVGDLVRIVETRPMSKMKRWRVQTILEKAE